MKKTALALVSALLLVAACDSSSTDSGAAGGAGGAGMGGYGSGSGALAPNVSDRVFFGYDSSVIDGEGQSILARQADWLKGNGGVNVVIEGHCDERGTREYNLALGERRANAAKDYLVNMGVPASRISTISYGKERPAVTGNDESSWSQNRRAVTVIAN